MAILEHYQSPHKIFLSHLVDRIKAEEFISSDLKVHEVINQHQQGLKFVGFDVPLSLPKCLRCTLPCPGYETCQEPEIKWLKNQAESRTDKKKPTKIFSPYLVRCADSYLAQLTKDALEIPPALGANLAPVTARALFIRRRLNFPVIEVSARVAVWRLGLQLKLPKSGLRVYRNSVGGQQARSQFLQAFGEKFHVFIYHQDFKSLVESINSFEALIAAFVCYLKQAEKTEARPKSFPKFEQWVEIPEGV